MVLAKVLAIAIFVCMFALIISEKIERHYVTLAAGALMLILVLGICMHSPEAIVRTLNYKSLGTLGFWYGKGGESTGINWSTIIFIAGMTVMVGSCRIFQLALS